jgi:hypothetical protein
MNGAVAAGVRVPRHARDTAPLLMLCLRSLQQHPQRPCPEASPSQTQLASRSHTMHDLSFSGGGGSRDGSGPAEQEDRSPDETADTLRARIRARAPVFRWSDTHGGWPRGCYVLSQQNRDPSI